MSVCLPRRVPRSADAYLAVFGVLPSPADDFCAGAGDAHSGGGSPSRSPPRAEGSDSGDDEDNAEEAAELRRVHSADGAHRMLALAQAMRSICALTQAPDGSGPIQIRLGLHVGPAVAAVVGTQMLRCVRENSHVNTYYDIGEHVYLNYLFTRDRAFLYYCVTAGQSEQPS